MPTQMIPRWLRDRIGLDVPVKVTKPWYMSHYQVFPRRVMIDIGCKAVYRVWRKLRSTYIEEHYVKIDSEVELNEMTTAISDNNWSATFLWFYEYPTMAEYFQLMKDIDITIKDDMDLLDIKEVEEE